MNSKLWDQQKERHECQMCSDKRVKQSVDTDTDTDTEFYYTLAAISRIAE